MIHQQNVVEVIDTHLMLARYRKNLPEFTQLRTISATSLMRTFGGVTFVWDTEEDIALLVPYNLKFSHQKKERMNVTENPKSLAIRAVLVEAGLDVLSEPYTLGKPIPSFNTDPESDSEIFYKYVNVVTKVTGSLRNSEQILADKNGRPVWVKRFLLPPIFEETVMIDGKIKYHPQLEPYRRFDEFAFAYSNLK